MGKNSVDGNLFGGKPRPGRNRSSSASHWGLALGVACMSSEGTGRESTGEEAWLGLGAGQGLHLLGIQHDDKTGLLALL